MKVTNALSCTALVLVCAVPRGGSAGYFNCGSQALNSAGKSTQCKPPKTALNDNTAAHTNEACRSFKSEQSAPEMMDWMLQALRVQRATQNAMLETVDAICTAQKLPCAQGLKFVEMIVNGVPTGSKDEEWIDCYLDQIEIENNVHAKAMANAFRVEYAKRNGLDFNTLAVKGMHTDGDSEIGCAKSTITQTIKVKVSQAYSGYLAPEANWADGKLNASEIASLTSRTASPNVNTSKVMAGLINSQANLLGINASFLTVKQISRTDPSTGKLITSAAGRRLADAGMPTDDVNLMPIFSFSGDALAIVGREAARSRFY